MSAFLLSACSILDPRYSSRSSFLYGPVTPYSYRERGLVQLTLRQNVPPRPLQMKRFVASKSRPIPHSSSEPRDRMLARSPELCLALRIRVPCMATTRVLPKVAYILRLKATVSLPRSDSPRRIPRAVPTDAVPLKYNSATPRPFDILPCISARIQLLVCPIIRQLLDQRAVWRMSGPYGTQERMRRAREHGSPPCMVSIDGE